MVSHSTVSLDTELRKLRPAELYTLGQILNLSDSWKKLMAIVPKEDDCNVPKFNTEHFSMIEQAAQQQKRSGAEIFLSEWGTMGKRRPTLRVLLDLLVKAELFRAADYLAGDILKEELPKRPNCGPAAPVKISDEVLRNLVSESEEFGNFSFNESLILELPSEVYNNEAVNPNVKDNSSLERNMQSTKLVSNKEKHEKHLDNLNAEMSDLMKFSNEQSKQQVFEPQELSSRELPVFLNEFERRAGEAKLNQEVLSEELPVFLNQDRISSSNNSSNDRSTSSSDSSNVNNNELVSAELPQCILGLRGSESNSDNNCSITNNRNLAQNMLNTQELPITVVEYNNKVGALEFFKIAF
ncbi:protein Tube [Ceratina calcarata]|uniref:Protein Tube n=1 Tax=Ceratina calcarata TaxID=156304 RepID=A0AAJ7JA17_9HYME|nr:protein Tube [Ceratina calcarata]